MFTTFTSVFETAYGFNAGEAGLSYLGLGIGSLIGQYGLDIFMKRRRRRILAQSGQIRPEEQLLPLTMAGLLMALGLFWYGWSIEYKIHWIVPIIGTSLCGISITFSFLGVQTYLIDVFTIHAASALAANTFVRCVFGVTIPLAGPPLYNRLGLGWGNTLLGFLALTVSPASFWLLKYGERIRTNPKFQLDP